MKSIAIFGTSGFALEVADICEDQGYDNIVLISKVMEEVNTNGLQMVEEGSVRKLDEDGFDFAIAISEPMIMKKIFYKYESFNYPNLIHSSVVMGRNQKNKFEHAFGNIIAAGCILTNSIKVGNFSILNLNSTIGHDCTLGDFISVMPNASISGNVSIDNEVFVGVSATILQGSVDKKMLIGEQSIIGGFSLVTKPVEPNATVVGIPAKRIK
jgi:sugar O-acyltransferase (sialic acid O-acetyltransferase NeuD family)